MKNWKRRVLALALTLCTAALMLAPMTSFAETYLVQGAQGGEVVQVQSMLYQLGYYWGTIDGDYGAYTVESVRAFQADYGLFVDGEAGPVTIDYLWALTGGPIYYSAQASSEPAADTSSASAPAVSYSFSGELYLGVWSDDVVPVQQMLIDLGYLNSVADGYYGPMTEDAVIRFQQKDGQWVDGVVGPLTYDALVKAWNNKSKPAASSAPAQTSAPKPSAPAVAINSSASGLSYGASGDQVRAVQQRLYDLGYLCTAPDGYFGDSTYAAVCTLQSFYGDTNPSGVVTDTVLGWLNGATVPFSPIQPGSAWSAIYVVQVKMMSYGFFGGADGLYEEGTMMGARQVQKVYGLPQTGICDATTIYHLYNYVAPTPPSSAGDVQGYYSNTNYLIIINTTTNRMYVYQGGIWNWSLLYNWPCSTGAYETPTTIGEYTTNFKGYSFGDGSTYTCYYFTSFNGPYYMHSTLYSPGGWTNVDARLGLNLSHGCVRLETGNAKWVYDNIPLGTKVVTVQ